MKVRHLLLLSGILVITVSWLTFSKTGHRIRSLYFPKQHTSYPLKKGSFEKLKLKAAIAAKFVRQKGLNESICFLIDMSLPSGQNRFFIYNLKSDSLQAHGLVAHGNCFEYWLEGRRYSNVVGSGCTSLGKYKIGNHYTGKFGYSYKLLGLDSSNNNAFERTVVLHAHSCIPETEVENEICQSNGCPTVAPMFLEQLKKIINTSIKPVLLWIYE
jgi:hypothetical protein